MSADLSFRTNGYTDVSAAPNADPIDLRKAWFRRKRAKADGATLAKFTIGLADNAIGFSVMMSMFGFAAWGWRVQRFEDAMLKLERAKLEHHFNSGSVAIGSQSSQSSAASAR